MVRKITPTRDFLMQPGIDKLALMIQERRSASLINKDVRLRGNQLLFQIANNGLTTLQQLFLHATAFLPPAEMGRSILNHEIGHHD